jgi:two-component system sensor histidine kinase QseC
VETTLYGDAGPGRKGSVMTMTFELEGQQFIALNGGPDFKPSMGTSLFVNCETQAEVDEFWEKLSEGGEKLPCGWLKDKFGFYWQVAPSVLLRMIRDKDPKKANKAMEAMMKMGKIDIAGLKRAYEGA